LRILVDESLPRHFVAEITGHDVSTVRDQGWLGLRNGVLLRAAAERGFDVLVTADRSVEFQQNLEKLQIAVIILGGQNRLPDLKRLVPQLQEVIAAVEPGTAVRIGD
jgi:hypothetical protein